MRGHSMPESGRVNMAVMLSLRKASKENDYEPFILRRGVLTLNSQSLLAFFCTTSYACHLWEGKG